MQAFFSPCSAKTDSKPSQRPIDGYVAVLGTGGTIAGQASGGAVNEHLDYKSGEVGIDALIGDLAHRVLVVHGDVVSVGVGVQCEQVAQIDSKNASWDFLWLLAAATAKALAKPQCMGVVVTHGTDTLEETAWFLSCVLGDRLADKPVVLTCAMLLPMRCPQTVRKTWWMPSRSPRMRGPVVCRCAWRGLVGRDSRFKKYTPTD